MVSRINAPASLVGAETDAGVAKGALPPGSAAAGAVVGTAVAAAGGGRVGPGFAPVVAGVVVAAVTPLADGVAGSGSGSAGRQPAISRKPLAATRSSRREKFRVEIGLRRKWNLV